MTCTVDGCAVKARCRGLCAGHYAEWKNADPTRPRCTVEGCGRAAITRDLCTVHYRRLRQRGTVGGPDLEWTHNPPPTCSVDGCDEPHTSKGYCTRHYVAWRYYGDPLGHRDRKTGCIICHHPDRQRIEYALAIGVRLTDIDVPGARETSRVVQLSSHARDCMRITPRRRVCRVCIDERVGDIDAALSRPRAKVAPLARHYGIGYSVLNRHARRHLGNDEYAAAIAAYHVARLAAVRSVLAPEVPS